MPRANLPPSRAPRPRSPRFCSRRDAWRGSRVHERRVGERLRQALPGVGVYLSCEVLPEIRELERASTTAACAYVGPLLAGYLDRLQSAISAVNAEYEVGGAGHSKRWFVSSAT
jgi:hypothetical protein